MAISFTKTNYEAKNKAKWYRLGPKNPSLTLRIAPAFLRDTDPEGTEPTWFVYQNQHFGYTLKVKDRSIPVTFSCIQRKDKNKNIIQSCPECDEISLRKVNVETKEKSLKESGKSEAEIAGLLRPSKAWLKDHNLDRKIVVYGKDESGEWGFVSMPNSAFKDLRREIDEIRKNPSMGFPDPLAAEDGLWFTFVRTETGPNLSDVKYTCKVATISEARGKLSIRCDSLTQSDFDQLEKLDSLRSLGRVLTYDQISSLVQSGGDDEVVKTVFDSAREASPTPSRAAAPSARPASVVPDTSFDTDAFDEEEMASSPQAVPVVEPEKVKPQIRKAALEMELADFKAKYS